MTDTVTILKAARDLIAKPENWIQGAYARSEDGRDTMPYDVSSTCFCSVGALFKAGADSFKFSELLPFEIRDAFGVMKENDLVKFNDTHTHAEVLSLFSKAITSAEEAER